MDFGPVTLGDWFEILKPEDFIGAATFISKGKTPPEWLPTFLMQWAPEVIMQRQQTEANVSREHVMSSLAKVEAACAELAELLKDPAVMKFLQMPPNPPFESEPGIRMAVDHILLRAHEAATSPTLVRGDGRGNSGAGKASTSDEVSSEQLCATIVGEAWHALHGSYPKAYKPAAAAASAYWAATGGKSDRSVGSSPVGRWLSYFKKLQDAEYLWGRRKEMKRQLLSWMEQ